MAKQSEIKKTRPAVVISNNIQNDIAVRLIVAPITSNINKIYPFEVLLEIADKQGKAQLDQIRTIDIKRLGEFIISLFYEEVQKIDLSLKLILSL